MKKTKFAVSFFTVFSLLMLFQNCGSSLDYAEYGVLENSSLQLQAPSIDSFPTNHNVTAGAMLNLTAQVSGSQLSYQWYKGSAAIQNAIGNVYAVSSASSSDTGTYTLKVSNAAGTVQRSVNVTVTAAPTPTPAPTAAPTPTPTPVPVAKPSINDPVDPVTATMFSDTAFLTSTAPSTDSASYQTDYNMVVFSVGATGLNRSYQWYFVNNSGAVTPISGATGATYSFHMTSVGQAGTYRVVVSNTGGSVSSEATLSYSVFQFNYQYGGYYGYTGVSTF